MQKYVQIYSISEARDGEQILAYHESDPSKNYQFTRDDIDMALAASNECVRGDCTLLVWRDLSGEDNSEAIKAIEKQMEAATNDEEKAFLDYRLNNLKAKAGGEENKQHICDLLLPALQATRSLHDLASLTYDSEKEAVIATFDSGFSKKANVACDSGIAMIRDILKQIV